MLDVDITRVTSTNYDTAGFPEAQLENLGDGGEVPAESYHPFGFIGRPKDPDVDPSGNPTNAAVALDCREGNSRHAIPLGDPRRTPKLPQIDKGGAMMYADVDGAYTRYKGDGTYECRVPAGKTVTVQVGAGAKIVISDGQVTAGTGGEQAVALSLPVLSVFSTLLTWLTLAEPAIENIPAPLTPTQITAINNAKVALAAALQAAPLATPTKVFAAT